MFYSLFSYPVLLGGAVSGLAFVLLTFLRRDMSKHLRWLWSQVAGFLLIIAPLAALMLVPALMLVLWLLSGYAWSHTAYKWIGCAVPVVFGLTMLFVNGANRDRK